MQPDDNNDVKTENLNTSTGVPTSGNALDDPNTTNNSTGDALSPAFEQPVKPKKSKKGLILGVLLVLVLLCVGVVVTIIVMNPGGQTSSNDDQSNTSNETVDEDDEEEESIGEPIIEIEQVGTAEVENGTFSIKDQSGNLMIEDKEMANAMGVKECAYIESEVQPTINCLVSTSDGEGVYVYYVEENIIKFATQ